MRKLLARHILRRQEKKRKVILGLIGRDIDDMCRRAYDDGVYVTQRQMRAERIIEFDSMMKQNEHLRKIIAEQAALEIPAVVLTTHTDQER